MHAYQFLLAVVHLLFVKRKQAQVAIAFYTKPWRSQRSSPGGGWKIRTAENVAVDIEYAQLLKELKHVTC